MSADREKLIKEIFADALEKSDPAELELCLSKACGGDAELRWRVEALLRAYEKAGAFLEQPAAPSPGNTITVAWSDALGLAIDLQPHIRHGDAKGQTAAQDVPRGLIECGDRVGIDRGVSVRAEQTPKGEHLIPPCTYAVVGEVV